MQNSAPKMIFINLPVVDVQRATAFYEALGFVKNPQFSNDTTACMVWSDTIFVMLLEHARWADFTSRPIPDSGSSEVLLCLMVEARDDVHRLADLGGASGGTADINPAQDHGFMISRALADPDGHVWELAWMDPAAMSGEQADAAQT